MTVEDNYTSQVGVPRRNFGRIDLAKLKKTQEENRRKLGERGGSRIATQESLNYEKLRSRNAGISGISATPNRDYVKLLDN